MIKAKDKTKLAFSLNIAIISSLFIGFVMFFAQLFPGPAFQKPLMSNFKYYSLIVNTLELAVAIAMVVYLNKCLKQKKSIPKSLNILNLITTSALVVNTLFTIVYLIPMGYILLDKTSPESTVFNPIMLLTEANLFFNIVVPALAFSQFCFCIKNIKIENKHILFGLILPLIYLIFYVTMCLTHIDGSGIISQTYDWYSICISSKYYLILFAILFLGASALIPYCLIVLNKRVEANKELVKIILYSFVILFALIGLIWMFMNSKANETYTLVQVVLSKFMYITNLTSMFILFAGIVGLIINIRLYRNKIKNNPNWTQNLMLFATTLALVVLLFNSAVSLVHLINYKPFDYGKFKSWKLCYSRYLLFEHLLTPTMILLIYFLCEHRKKDVKIILYSALPFAIYALVYAILFYCNLNTPYPEKVEPYWDVYIIFKSMSRELSAKIAWLAPIGIYGAGILLSWVSWFINRKIKIGYKK